MENNSVKTFAKGIQFIGLALLLVFFFTKSLLFSSLGIIIGCGGALVETFISYKETGRLDYIKTIIFSITFLAGFNILFA